MQVQSLGQEDPGWEDATLSILNPYYDFWIPWWLRQLRICPQCGRPAFDPWGPQEPLEKGMATHSGMFAWRIPWTEEPGGRQYMGSQRVDHN